MLVPIGSWCRTAYQVREFLLDKDTAIQSYPYDWTITPFAALKTSLSCDFDSSNALRLSELAAHYELKTLVDEYTKIIHYHDFSPSCISSLAAECGINEKGVPLKLSSALLDKVRGRFQYTFTHFLELKEVSKVRKIGFVRWNRLGHPDLEVPEAFQGEDLESLSNLLQEFLGNNNFSILQVTSDLSDHHFGEAEIVKDYSICQVGAYSVIRERKGFDGDGTDNFKGDTRSWNMILSKFVMDFNIPVKICWSGRLRKTLTLTSRAIKRSMKRSLGMKIQ